MVRTDCILVTRIRRSLWEPGMWKDEAQGMIETQTFEPPGFLGWITSWGRFVVVGGAEGGVYRYHGVTTKVWHNALTQESYELVNTPEEAQKAMFKTPLIQPPGNACECGNVGVGYIFVFGVEQDDYNTPWRPLGVVRMDANYTCKACSAYTFEDWRDVPGVVMKERGESPTCVEEV